VIAGVLAAVGGSAIGCRGTGSLDELRADAKAVGFDLSDSELKAIQSYVADFLKAADRVSNAIPPAPSPKYDHELQRDRQLPKIRSMPGT